MGHDQVVESPIYNSQSYSAMWLITVKAKRRALWVYLVFALLGVVAQISPLSAAGGPQPAECKASKATRKVRVWSGRDNWFPR